jgi:NAD-dependent dihydropyrimidine dehydrogenase PreA subunit
MGHLSHHKAYRDLRARLDQLPATFPDTPEGLEVLSLIFTPEEAELARRLPFRPQSARRIARRLGRPEAEVRSALERMAERGLVLDLHNARKDRMYYCVAPPVVGFVEFSLMRRRSDLDQGALARRFEELFARPELFAQGFFAGETQIGRTLVHEQTLAPDQIAELLPYERASEVVRSASSRAVSLCYCRHKAEHLGKQCSAPMENCLSLNKGAEFVARHGHGRPIDEGEAAEILARSREAGLVFIADNVQRRVTYICSCCGCCCAQLQAVNRHGLVGAVRTSSSIATIDRERCTGCGRCARRCPVQAIAVHVRAPHERVRPAADGKERPMLGVVDEGLCLGCGVCQPVCRKGALRMTPRAERVLTPESTVERLLLTALERDRLQHLLFDAEEGPSMLLLNRLAGAALRLPAVKRVLLGEALRSRFLAFLSQRGRELLPAGTEV